MRGQLCAGVVLALLVRGAYAADSAMPAKIPPATPAAYDWTGFYIGAHIASTAGSSNWTATFPGVTAPPVTGSLDFFHPYDAFTGSGSYFAGFQGSYNYMLPSRLLLGIEGDISFPNTVGGTAVFSTAASGVASYAEQVEMSGTLRGRIGYASGHWLFYAPAA